MAHLPRNQGRGLSAVFVPKSVAVVGASDKEGKMGTTFMRNLSGFAGEVFSVSTSQDEVFGIPSYRSLLDIPGRVDLALVIVPARAVPEVLEDASRAGVQTARS